MALSPKLGEIVEWRGVEALVAAEVLVDDNESGEGHGYVTGDVFSIAGVNKISRTTSTSTETKYYDNMAAMVTNATGADEVTMDVSAVDMEVRAQITGQTYDASTGSFIEGDRTVKYFAIGYKTKKTNGDEVYVWRYKGTFNIPDQENSTETDGTESSGEQLVFTGVKTTHMFTKGKHVSALNVDVSKDKADVSTFFDTVTTPDSLTPKA